MLIDDDAVLWSAPAAERAGRPLLVLLHGYDLDEHQLFDRAVSLTSEPVIAALRAPLVADTGYAWYEIGTTRTWAQMSEDAQRVAAEVVEWIDRVAPEASSVALAGFSQGGAITMEAMRRAPDRFAFAVLLSSTVMQFPRPGDARLAERRPPVLWARGTADTVLAAIRIRTTTAFLDEHTDVDARLYEGLDHSVSDEEMADLGVWLRARYADGR
ncbi:alpha/beta fold hydrolase [Agromyces protaetiae]|uniref:Alpha/beta fold hydrolase n=1 Tax=Agromyces protaetiae TaxID=2509455 RepID=A0A4P6FA84_9MICO|nr:alpha/beta hydrolase-fold protein [Agromyces protaetiae]QAY73110.1 alpha/beta fold hydrolase [Agromyces protaetiae]